MKCPACPGTLKEVMAKNGVLVDYCSECKGIWLDQGEIFSFSSSPKFLHAKLADAAKSPRPSKRVDPKTGDELLELHLADGALIIDYSPTTHGIWLDQGELEKIPAAKKIALKIALDKETLESEPEKELQVSRGSTLPNLSLASSITLFLLYGMITLLLITLNLFGLISPNGALLIGVLFAVIQFLLSPLLLDLQLKWFYHIEWGTHTDLPNEARVYLEEISKKENIKIPRIGIIPDGSPNAFTYGHTPNNARIVITSGTMQLLSPQELTAVIAHEVGHAVHWDMLVMTIAYIVPLFLYHIYRSLIRMRSSGRDKSAPYRYAVAISAYILYIISQYIVLWFSRVREYYADRFSGETTQDPGALASALVKIGYGLAGKEKEKNERKAELEGVKALGIFDSRSARGLAVTSFKALSMGNELDKSSLQSVMRWDLWNPWAMYYELHSTHPLIAKRLQALSSQAVASGKEPFVIFNEKKPESYWDDFLIDYLVYILPTAIFIISLVVVAGTRTPAFIPWALCLYGISALLKVKFSYASSLFPEMNIASLLKTVKVSPVSAIPCTVKGRFIGRGIPGLIWSEDFVLQDSSGIIFIDYKQPLALWNFFFGLTRAQSFTGEEVTLDGWYRRAPIPYIELKHMRSPRDEQTCHTYTAKLCGAVLIIALGVLSFFFF
jgi:Zn-dependent protease with chaperone function/Zn-finger nucleic acid-binding protein